jgi:hypothetical protein
MHSLSSYFKEREKKKRGNGLSWMMRRNREDMEVGSSEPSKRYAPTPLTCTRRESGLPSLEICGSATAHLSVPHTLRRRERRHNPSQPIPFTQRCVRQMGRWSSFRYSEEAGSTNQKLLHPLLWLVCGSGKRPVGDKRNTKNKFGNKINLPEQSKKVEC